MEKTTKKRKKSKRLKRRIGLIAVGGLSFVLTICLSVGATLAWFAGSTWASNDLYMGGPVYVEMAGRGQNGYETGTDGGVGEDYATWTGGAGSLDIVASSRSTGTKDFSNGFAAKDKQENILLPGQKLLIYSQARVYSTLEKTTLADNTYDSESSGANNSNTSDGTYKYYNGTGSVQSTTTSVLRAKFSINIEFDPSVGFNNFTDRIYAEGYPVQSSNYLGEYGTDDSAVIGTVNTSDKTSKDEASRDAGDDGKLNTADDVVVQKDSLTWASALGATPYKIVRDNTGAITSEKGRRDAVDNTALEEGSGKDYLASDYAHLNASVTPWVDGSGTNDMWQVKYGLSKCIYQWKYVSKKAYDAADASLRIGAPFNGLFNTAGGPSAADKTAANGSGNGFYAIWVTKGSETTAGTNKANIQESGAFFKSRTSNYLKSYVEHYKDDYGRDLVMEIGDQLETLEDALNDSFVNLVNQSTDNIWAGNLMGFNAEEDGRITYPSGVADPDDDTGLSTSGIPASWLYVDPVIGNDTNSADNASSVGGWWYLVENDATKGNKTTGNNTIITEIDNVVHLVSGTETATGATTLQADGTVKYDFGSKEAGQITNNTDKVPADAYNKPIPGTGNAVAFQRLEDASKDTEGNITETSVEFVGPKDKRILNAKLYEIVPSLTDKLMATNPATGTTTTKVVSVAFPFVNGNFELPGQALTNVFANAKISFQITFQALQAFFPFSNSIDSIPSGTAITGTAKALNIGNAIPIYNEAFDYLSWL